MKITYIYEPISMDFTLYVGDSARHIVVKKGTAKEIIDFLIECIEEQHIKVDKNEGELGGNYGTLDKKSR